MLPRSSLRLPIDACSDAAADAIEASAHRSHPHAFDLVVSGGGLAAFYGGAVSSVLATLARRGVLEVGSLHGVSSGALVCATFLGCEAGFTKLSDMYRCHDIFMGLQEGLQERRRPWLSYGMRQFLDESLPPDIHERATGRMHVTVSELLAPQEGKARRNLWPRKRVISDFPTREALLDTVMASTIIPGITAPHPHPTSCGGYQLDGAKVLAPPPSAEAPQLRIEQLTRTLTLTLALALALALAPTHPPPHSSTTPPPHPPLTSPHGHQRRSRRGPVHRAHQVAELRVGPAAAAPPGAATAG